MMVLAALIPALTPRGYGYQTAAITPVILLLSDILNHQGIGLVLPRLLDSLMGCAIALVAGYLLWPESWHTRIGDRLADAVADTATYVERAFGARTPTSRPPAPGCAAASTATCPSSATEFQRALTEPPPTGRRAAAWWPLVVAVERIVDATTAARVRVKHGAPAPGPAEVAQAAGNCGSWHRGCASPTSCTGCAPTSARPTATACWNPYARRSRPPARSPHRTDADDETR